MRLTNVQLEAICRIAEDAGAAIMNIYRGEIDFHLKGDDSPLTLADLKSDEIIRKGLMSQFPGIPIISEESQSEIIQANDQFTFFLVDPLDGTKEFINRNGEFTVNIGLIHQRYPIAGVVYAPALNAMYYAGDGLGAWKRSSAIEPISTIHRDDHLPLRVVGSRSHGGTEMEAWLAKLKCQYSLVTSGSSLKFCKVAEGMADVYPRLAPTSQWDTAAGQSILEEAGGSVLTIDGERLTYGSTRPILNPSFIASGADRFGVVAPA